MPLSQPGNDLITPAGTEQGLDMSHAEVVISVVISSGIPQGAEAGDLALLERNMRFSAVESRYPGMS